MCRQYRCTHHAARAQRSNVLYCFISATAPVHCYVQHLSLPDVPLAHFATASTASLCMCYYLQQLSVADVLLLHFNVYPIHLRKKGINCRNLQRHLTAAPPAVTHMLTAAAGAAAATPTPCRRSAWLRKALTSTGTST
jgi:hypothetical protein